MVLWGLATAAQLWMHNKATFLICRAFVGMFEAGYIPGIAIYLTTYYKRQEMALRMSIFWSTLAIANSCAGVLAYFILQLRGTADLAGWKWLFLIEGVATTFVGVLSFFILPEGPTATRGYLRFAGYLTERQELIAITRLIRDDPSKADPSKKIVPKADVWRAVKSPRIWPNLLIGFFGLLPSTPIGGFAPLILKMLGFNGLKANLMTIPGFLLGLAVMSLVSYSSDKFNERAFHGAAATLYYACCVAGLALLPIGTDKVNLYICLIFAMGGSTCWHPVNVSHTIISLLLNTSSCAIDSTANPNSSYSSRLLGSQETQPQSANAPLRSPCILSPSTSPPLPAPTFSATTTRLVSFRACG